MQLQIEHVVLFHERFFDFYDGVVRGIELEVGVASRSCTIEVQCKDRDSPSGWARVTFAVRAVTEFRFQLGRTTFEVLSGGMQIAWCDGRVYLVLDAYPDDGPDLPDLSKNIAYVAGGDCEWSCVEDLD